MKTKLKKNNLIITKTDRGNTLVITDKKDYINKTQQFINANKCIILKRDPTPEYQEQRKT